MQVKGGIDPSFPGSCQNPFFQAVGTYPIGSASSFVGFSEDGGAAMPCYLPYVVTLPRQREESNSAILEETVGSLRSPLYSKASGKKKKNIKISCDKFLSLPHMSFAGQKTQISDKESTMQLPRERVI